MSMRDRIVHSGLERFTPLQLSNISMQSARKGCHSKPARNLCELDCYFPPANAAAFALPPDSM